MAYLINKARVKQRSAIIALLDLQNAFGEVQKFILACIIVSQPSTNYLRARIVFEWLRYGHDRKFKNKNYGDDDYNYDGDNNGDTVNDDDYDGDDCDTRFKKIIIF